MLYDDCTASEPVYDEAYTNLRAAQQEGREMADPARAPMLTSPAEGESIPALGSPPTFRWTYPGTARVSGPKDVRAHGCTVIGDVFWMRLTLPGGETLHVLNLNTDWTADEATWTKIKPTGGSTPPGCVGRRAHAVEPHHRGSLPWRRAHLARALTDLRESHPSRPRPVDV